MKDGVSNMKNNIEDLFNAGENISKILDTLSSEDNIKILLGLLVGESLAYLKGSPNKEVFAQRCCHLLNVFDNFFDVLQDSTSINFISELNNASEVSNNTDTDTDIVS